MFPFQISNLLGFIKTNNFSCSTAIDEKLSKPNCSLEELLDEEEIIQEMKYQNIKLLNFFDKERVKQLLDFILVEPKEDDFKRGHRYPFIASEILNSDSNKIYDLFFEKTNPNKNSVDSSYKKSVELTDKKGKENDMDTFSFEEKKDPSLVKEDFNVNSETNPIKEEIPLTSSQAKQEGNVSSLPKNEIIENKLQELHIKQDVDVNMNIDDKDGSNCRNPDNGNKENINLVFTENTNVHHQIDDKIEVDEEPHKVGNQNNEPTDSNDPKEDVKMTKENVCQEQNKIEEKKEIDLLEYFLNFLNTSQPLNYVLCGYFAKLFNTLLNKNSNYIIHYIWEKRPDVLNRLLYHCNRKSLAELLVRLIQIETTDVELSHQAWVKELRHNFLSEFVLKLRSEDLEEVDNAIWVLSDIIDNRSLLEFAFENKTFLKTLFENISAKDVKMLNFVETINLVILVNKFCWVENFQMPVYAQSTDETLVSYNEKEIIHSELSLLTKNHLLSILDHFNNENESSDNNMWETTFGSSYKPLGNRRIKVLEYLLTVFNLMKTAIHEVDTLLVDKENARFFPTLFNLFFQYEWNNFYQQNFEGIINFIFSNTQGFPQTIKYLFEEFNLISYLIERSKYSQFTFNSNRKMNHGFWANFIELCSKINSVTDTEVTKHFTDEWKQFVKDKVEYWKNLFSRQLSAVVKNNFSFNFDDKPDFQNTANNTNSNYGNENTPQEENKTSEFKPQNATDFFNNLGTSNDADWLNNYSKTNQDSSKFDKELENFEFYEDKKTDNQEEPQVNDSQTQNAQQSSAQEITEEKENFQVNTNQNGENNFSNFENVSSSDTQNKNNDIFNFDENGAQRKEDIGNEVDKMVNQINN